jgi:putative membrane protein
MKKTLSLTILALSLSAGAPALAASTADQTFLQDAIRGNLAEVEMGQLAQQKGRSDAVKSYGRMLVTDHTANNEKATQLAEQSAIPAPSQPSAKQKADYEMLSKLSGAAFDRQFAKMMVMDHKKDIGMFKREAAKKNDPLAQYASDTLPVLQKHLDAAEKLEQNKSASR